MGNLDFIVGIREPVEERQGQLRNHLSTLRRRRGSIFLVFIVITATAVALSFLTPPVYRATTQIIFEKPPLPRKDIARTRADASQERMYFRTLINLLHSRDLALGVIDALSLWSMFGYDGMSETDKPAMIDRYLKGLKIDSIPKSYLINVSYQCQSPNLAAQIANTHVRHLIEKHTRRQTGMDGRLLQAVNSDSEWLNAMAYAAGQEGGEQKAGQSSNGEKNSHVDILMRKAKTNQEADDLLLYKRARVFNRTGAMGPYTVRIVDVAKLPQSPIWFDKMLNILLGVIAGLFLGVALALFKELMDNSVKAPHDILGLGMPVLASIPQKRIFRNVYRLLPASDQGNNVFSKIKARKLYNLPVPLFNALKKSDEQSDGRVVIFESAETGEGKSTALSNLAVSLSNAGLRVVMADCDFKNPSLHALFRKENVNGLKTVMEHIISTPLSRGSLEEYSVEDLFFLASLKRFSGQLFITNSRYFDFLDIIKELGRIDGVLTSASEAQVMRITFFRGRLIQIDDQFSPQENRIGTVLYNDGIITREQMMDALVRNKSTGMPLGYILINMGYIKPNDLQGPLQLQMEENLHKVFNWRHGTFSFEAEDPLIKEKQGVYYLEDFNDSFKKLNRVSGSIFLQELLLKSLTSILEPNLYLLNSGCGNGTGNPGGVTDIVMISKFLNILKRHYDVVLVDTPPLLDRGEMVHLASAADGAIFLIKAGNLSVKKLRAAKECLDESDCNVIGAVLNQVKSH